MCWSLEPSGLAPLPLPSSVPSSPSSSLFLSVSLSSSPPSLQVSEDNGHESCLHSHTAYSNRKCTLHYIHTYIYIQSCSVSHMQTFNIHLKYLKYLNIQYVSNLATWFRMLPSEIVFLSYLCKYQSTALLANWSMRHQGKNHVCNRKAFALLSGEHEFESSWWPGIQENKIVWVGGMAYPC